MTLINPIYLAVILQTLLPPESMWSWIVQQTAVAVILGIVAYFQWDAIKGYKKDLKEQSAAHKVDLQAKDTRITELANKALAVASLYDVKSDMNTKEHDQILKLIGELRDLVRDLPKAKN